MPSELSKEVRELSRVYRNFTKIEGSAMIKSICAILERCADALDCQKISDSSHLVSLRMLRKQFNETQAMCRTTSEWIVLKGLLDLLIETESERI